MKRRTGGSTMHAWHPHHDPRSTPPPKSKTKLAASFEEFDREHMRIKLIERSILKAQATRQDRLTEEAQARTLATKAHHAIEAHHNQLSPVRGGHSPVRGGSRRQNHHSRSPNRRKIRLLDHLSKEETLSIEMGLKEVVRMRKHAEEIEKAEIATRHLLAVNKNKKKVEMLLDELTAASDPLQLLEDKKNARSTRGTVESNLDQVQYSREQADLALQTVLISKDGLQNFILEAPPDLSAMGSSSGDGGSKKIQNPTTLWASVSQWQEKAMLTNQKLMAFCSDTKSMLESDILNIEEKLEKLNKKYELLLKKMKEKQDEIDRLNRELHEVRQKIKKVEQKFINIQTRMKRMESEFEIRTTSLRDEIKKLQTELSKLSSQLHLVTTERDELKVRELELRNNIVKLELECSQHLQKVKEMKRKCDQLEIQIKTKEEELKITKEKHAEEKASMESQITDLMSQLKHAQSQLKSMEKKYKDEITVLQKEMKEQKEKSAQEIKLLSQKLKASVDQIAADKERLKRAANEQQELAKKAKEEEEAKKKLDIARKAEAKVAQEQAEIQAKKLANALKRVPTKESTTQTDIEKEVSEATLQDRNQMIAEDLNSERIERVWTRTEGEKKLIHELAKQKEELLLQYNSKMTTDTGIQTPIELLNALRSELDHDEIEKISNTENLARKVLNKWMRNAIAKIFLTDKDLIQLMPRLDFERNGPAADLLKHLRQKGQRAVALSHVVLRAVNRVSLRDRQRKGILFLSTNCNMEKMRVTLQLQMKENEENVNILKQYTVHAKNQKLMHNHEIHETELRVLREESMSSDNQAKTLKSVAELVRQVSNTMEIVRDNIHLSTTEEKEQQGKDARVEWSSNDKISTSMHTTCNVKKNIKLQETMLKLGESCARWMLLIERRLPKLQVSGERAKSEISRLRREGPMKQVKNVKRVGLHDEMKKMKHGSRLLEV